MILMLITDYVPIQLQASTVALDWTSQIPSPPPAQGPGTSLTDTKSHF